MAEKKKGFANLNYPGIEADPQEVTKEIDPRVLEKCKASLERFGEAGLKHLLRSAVLIVPTEPLGVVLAKKLVTLGIGRVGLLGKSNTHKENKEELKKEYPWASYETFSALTIDRRAEDIIRGFSLLFISGQSEYEEDVLSAAQTESVPCKKIEEIGLKGTNLTQNAAETADFIVEQLLKSGKP